MTENRRRARLSKCSTRGTGMARNCQQLSWAISSSLHDSSHLGIFILLCPTKLLDGMWPKMMHLQSPSLENKLCSVHKPVCPHVLLHCLSSATASAVVQSIKLILEAPFELYLQGNHCALLSSASLFAVLPPLFSFVSLS